MTKALGAEVTATAGGEARIRGQIPLAALKLQMVPSDRWLIEKALTQLPA